MSWQCRLIEYKGEGSRDLQVGDMFYGPTKEEFEADEDAWGWAWFHCQEERLSEYYRTHNSHRRPLLVMLPNRTLFCVDGACWEGSRYYGGWTVIGEAPEITVHPSINCVGSYHGWLQNGLISPDCEGRQFPPTA